MMTCSHAKYYAQRIAPFFYLFIGAETLVRAIFTIVERDNLDSIQIIIQSFFIGFILDFAVFTFFMTLITFYLMLLPEKKHGTYLDRKFTSGFYLIFSYALLFGCLSEWFFWDEFSTRFNFIAVDYLVYTHEVIGNIWESYPVTPLLLGIGILSFILTFQFYRKFNTDSAKPKELTLKIRIAALIFSCLCLLGQFVTLDSSIAEISDNQYTTEIAKNGVYELFSAFRRNELRFDQFYVTADQNDLNTLLKKVLNNKTTQTQNILERSITPSGEENHYNIILLTVESLSANYMKAFGNQENLTPHLDDLANKSLFFTNFYAIGTRTVYGLTAITLSIPPIPGNAIVRRPSNENLFSLGAVLNTKGYRSKFIYGGFGYFDNMNYFFENNGYEIVDRRDLKPEEITFSNVWGVSDEDLLNRVLKESDELYAQGKPFFNMVMTTSNHRPYTYPEGKIDIPSKTGRKGAVKYTDYAIGKFIEQAKSKPWFNNTIFVIVADHTAGSGGKNEIDPKRYHIPLIIYAPNIIVPRVVNTLSSQIDVAPTLLGLLRLHYTSRFYGQNLLEENTPRAFVSNYQKVGYLTENKLVIFKPGKQINFYQKEGEAYLPTTDEDEKITMTALAYLQTANDWKQLNRSNAY
ncbi:MAG: sulfatase-like hydrolase/transferase [Gammaproteobacteria bacterium]